MNIHAYLVVYIYVQVKHTTDTLSIKATEIETLSIHQLSYNT